MSHKHWPADHPFYEAAPTCDLRTKAECDKRFSAWKREGKAAADKAEGERMSAIRIQRENTYQAYVTKEAARVAELLQ
jgi:hypothetical protein